MMIRTASPIRRIVTLLALTFALTASAPVSFQNNTSRAVAASVETQLSGARLSGEARFSVFGFHIYDARLFVTREGLGAGMLPDKPFALDLRYARNINGKDIAKRSAKEMASLKMGSPDDHVRWEKQMRAIFPNVGKGDHLTGIYIPGEGARFLKNGQSIGEVRDGQFAKAFFAIWLHPRTRAPSMRTALLQRAAQP